MAKVAFILLCHKDPERIVDQALRLVSQGDCVAIHFDGRGANSDFVRLQDRLAGHPNVCFAPRRIKCGWGEWSLVKATLETLQTALATFGDATHFYLISGDCQPIKSAAFVKMRLDPADRDYIEAVDFFTSGWIRTGMKEDRLRFRHVFNERRQKKLFYASLEAQRRLKLSRETPEGLRIMIGSQWWCLRRETIEKVLAFLASRPDIPKFFSTTWIPDETFFQTIVRHLVPSSELSGRAPTCLMFTDYGMPVTFYNDHYDFLIQQDAFFARKISTQAHDLRARLNAVWEDTEAAFVVSDEAVRLHRFLTGRGREGRRYAPRFWQESKPDRARELLLISTKKWHLAKRLLGRARETLGIPGVAFVFHEESCDLPDLGGLETQLKKRNRHRRALTGLLFSALQTDRMVLCLDLSASSMVDDLAASAMRVRLLEMECLYSDAYLTGHARRLGLISDQTKPETIFRLLPALRSELSTEHERLATAVPGSAFRVSETAGPEENTRALAAFFGVPEARLATIADTNTLFSD
ncbi:DUF5928 domain-containing protein [Tropicimonas sp. S265A]|uniref:DUF5928 domain-containing protein n=1 Tax=Tropicimonas sp. S265A TaxID=3415134 RepID=UPI003C7A058A